MRSTCSAVIALCLSVVTLGACASTAITTEQLAAADCGPTPSNYRQVIPEFFSRILKDPYSAQYRYGNVYRAYIREAPVMGGEPTQYGWIADVWVNAKNSFGGYVGEKFYRVFLRDHVCQGIVHQNSWFSEPWYN